MRQALHETKTIAVLRPNAVGDFVFCLPALHALRMAYPDARIIYIGKQWHADFMRARPGPIDEVAVIPPCPGVGAALDMDADQRAVDAFVDRMRRMEIDLAVQIYGGGRYANPFIRRLGARLAIGWKAGGAEPLDRWISYVQLQNKRLQMLEVASLAGANMFCFGTELQLTDEDRQEAQRVLPATSRPLILIQPGSSDVRRRWPAERFAAVADRLAGKGSAIAINGTAAEAPLVREMIERMRAPALDLSGRLSLRGLCGLLERASLVLSNDTGPLHLALAIGTPCVGIYWLTNMNESAPLVQHRHRAALSVRIQCPVCGMENRSARCAHDVSFVDDVGVEEVMGLAMELLAL